MSKLMKFALIAVVLIALAIYMAPAAMAAPCIVPPDDYFMQYSDGVSAEQIGATGLDAFPIWIVGNSDSGAPAKLQNIYLNLTSRHGTYKLRISHNWQITLAMKKAFYCSSLPDYPYRPPAKTGVSEDPSTSIYLTATEMRAQTA